MRRASAERLARVARAQRALARVAALERANAEAAHRDSIAAGEAIIASLSAESDLHGIIVPTMAKALRRNARHAEALRRNADLARARHMRDDTAARRLEEEARLAERAEGAKAERRRLEAVALESLARTIATRRASPSGKPPDSDPA
ncbi:hypothetical protein [Acuticoccus kandeliae]|uniref:hypothetical protein n=1 Tax=Acuticoccus kandeliae TaxID=2073160 RepID=UPI000D3EA745|nr:hypothetical protein [Acuticoccus kandeliae]